MAWQRVACFITGLCSDIILDCTRPPIIFIFFFLSNHINHALLNKKNLKFVPIRKGKRNDPGIPNTHNPSEQVIKVHVKDDDNVVIQYLSVVR